jgi:hypothetical protein
MDTHLPVLTLSLMKPITRNTLFYGDNQPVLRDHIPDESVHLGTQETLQHRKKS